MGQKPRNHYSNLQETANVYKQMPGQNTLSTMVRYDHQRRSVGKSETMTGGTTIRI
jgi:hypothetical protein